MIPICLKMASLYPHLQKKKKRQWRSFHHFWSNVNEIYKVIKNTLENGLLKIRTFLYPEYDDGLSQKFDHIFFRWSSPTQTKKLELRISIGVIMERDKATKHT